MIGPSGFLLLRADPQGAEKAILVSGVELTNAESDPSSFRAQHSA
jgi:hypothetical protein